MLNIMIPSNAQVITIVRMFFFFIIINVFSPYLSTYIVSVLRSLFISHILVFLVLIIQHIVPKIYTLGAKCSFYGVKYMMAVKKRESIKYFPFQNLIYRLLNQNLCLFCLLCDSSLCCSKTSDWYTEW